MTAILCIAHVKSRCHGRWTGSLASIGGVNVRALPIHFCPCVSCMKSLFSAPLLVRVRVHLMVDPPLPVVGCQKYLLLTQLFAILCTSRPCLLSSVCPSTLIASCCARGTGLRDTSVPLLACLHPSARSTRVRGDQDLDLPGLCSDHLPRWLRVVAAARDARACSTRTALILNYPELSQSGRERWSAQQQGSDSGERGCAVLSKHPQQRTFRILFFSHGIPGK